MDALRRAYDEIEVRVNERTRELSELAVELSREVERRQAAEEVLRKQSLTDPLTGLYNRRGFLALAEQQWNQAYREKRDMVFCFADVDGLKPINDSLGHAIGDEAIVQSAEALKETFRRADIVGRIGGDEFAIIAMDVPAGEEPVYFQRLRDVLDAINASGRLSFQLSLSLGFSRFQHVDPISISEMMRRADAELYQNKTSRALPGR